MWLHYLSLLLFFAFSGHFFKDPSGVYYHAVQATNHHEAQIPAGNQQQKTLNVINFNVAPGTGEASGVGSAETTASLSAPGQQEEPRLAALRESGACSQQNSSESLGM